MSLGADFLYTLYKRRRQKEEHIHFSAKTSFFMISLFEMRRLLGLVVLITVAEATFRDQSIGAKGYVTCRGVRQAGVFVQLFDEDTLSFLDSDDLMGSTTADINGHFCVKGTTSEFTDIDPYILIEHNCGYEGLDQKTVFFYYLNKEHIVEGTIADSIEHLGHIELLTHDAPVQEYSRRQHLLRTVHRTQHERIQECVPLYVTYKDFYEKEVFGERLVVSRKELEAESELPEITVEEPAKTAEEEKEEEPQGEVVKIEEKGSEAETELKIEEERVKLEKLKVEEERLHLERTKEEERLLEEERRREEELRVDEERRREVERKREEQRLKEEELRREEEKKREIERHLEEDRRRQEEERREEERKLREEERKSEEEKARLAYEKAMEEYRKREEARQLEIKRREEASKMSVEHRTIIKETQNIVDSGKTAEEEEYDPCAFRLKRHITNRFDPCNSSRKLRG